MIGSVIVTDKLPVIAKTVKMIIRWLKEFA
jgi:hypothetical protein